jgi:ABC-type glycerol-3-phosphate transport system permease component
MRKLLSVILHFFLFIIAAGMIFPMLWMIILSLKEYPEKYDNFLQLILSPFSFQNYFDALSTDAFGIYFLNSLIVVIIVSFGNILFCYLAGYALARRQFTAKPVLFGTILGVLIIPPHIIMIPLYRLMVEFGWINTYLALIILWLVTPFGIFLVRQYILTIPQEIEDAARIDGAGNWRIIFRIVMPLAKPILTVVGIYTFLSNWNSFLFPFLFTNQESMRTLPVGLAFYMGKQSIDWGHLMAGAALSAIPVIILFVFFQKKIIKGLTAGALKE